MKKNKYPYQLIGLFCLINSFVLAQEPFNSAIAYSSVSRNPALAGIELSDLQFNFCFHQQNQTILVPYQTLQAQVLSRFREKESEEGFTIGALIRQDMAGENQLSRKQFQPLFNFHKSLSDVKFSYLSFGLMANIVESKFDLSAIPSTDQMNNIVFYPPTTNILQTVKPNSSSDLDFNAGVSFFSEPNNRLSYYLGAAIYHFGQNALVNNNIESSLKKEIVLNSGFTYTENNFSIQVLTDLRIRNNGTSFYSGLLYGIPISRNEETKNKELQFGFYYNSKKELSPIISFNQSKFTVSVCYDIYLGQQKEIKVFRNAWELNLAFSFNCHKRTTESEKMKCSWF